MVAGPVFARSARDGGPCVPSCYDVKPLRNHVDSPLSIDDAIHRGNRPALGD